MAKKKAASGLIVWEDMIGIEQAASLKAQLLDSLSKSKSTKLDISKVTDLDTSIIQLLLSAAKEAESNDKEFYLVGTVPQDIQSLFDIMRVSIPVKSEPEE